MKDLYLLILIIYVDLSLVYINFSRSISSFYLLSIEIRKPFSCSFA